MDPRESYAMTGHNTVRPAPDFPMPKWVDYQEPIRAIRYYLSDMSTRRRDNKARKQRGSADETE